MELGAGVGEEEEERNRLEGTPMQLYRPTNLAVSPAGHQTVSAWGQTGYQYSSSVVRRNGLAHRRAARR
jgi:hypothetical protein